MPDILSERTIPLQPQEYKHVQLLDFSLSAIIKPVCWIIVMMAEEDYLRIQCIIPTNGVNSMQTMLSKVACSIINQLFRVVSRNRIIEDNS